MCGIFGYIGTLGASQIVFDGLRDLQYRGYDSWGIASLTPPGLVISKNIGALPENVSGLAQAHISLGHTRWATHGGVTTANSHPHVSCDQRFVVVHNGIIENFISLKSKLKEKHIFTSDTDTELIAHYLEENTPRHGFMPAFNNLIKSIAGHNAFVVVNCATKSLYAYRSGSPLVLGQRKDELFISSDLPTLSQRVDQIYPLSDGELVDLSKDLQALAWLPSPELAGDYHPITTKYHMESEMYETIEILDQHASINYDLADLAKRMRQAGHLILTGCGSSYHACLYGQYLFRQIGIIAEVIIASEGVSSLPTIDDDTVIIVLSQSGETIDTLDYVISARARGAYIVALTNVHHSTLDRLADLSFDLRLGVEVAVASTKAYVFMQLFFVDLAAHLGKYSLSTSLITYRHMLSLLYTPEGKHKAKDLAHRLAPSTNIFVISRGDLLSLGHEAALKFKEIGYLHAESVVSGELKHGPLALIDQSAMCLVIRRQDSTDMDSTIAEVKARKGHVIEINLPELGVLTPLYGANLTHLVSFYLSLELGINPDRPRNLAKSVTVK